MVSDISLNVTSASLTIDETKQLSATVLPSNATNKSLTWSTSNSSVATVSSTGLVTAKSIGSATITCMANDGSGVSDSCYVKVSGANIVEINSTNFPDESFRNYLLKQNYGTDGILTESEINNITSLSLSGSSSSPGNIKSLKGIEFLTALRDLWCGNNQLTALDVSKNTALRYLRCYDNQLTALDVSKNTALIQLSCDNNQLTALDVSKNTALEYLRCNNNQLTTLDVSKNTALDYLQCNDNQLTVLDVSKNTALDRLYTRHNPLTALDVSKNTALTYLDCRYNQLTTLDVSKNTALTALLCLCNKIKGTATDNLIRGLPVNTTNNIYHFVFIDPTNESEGNVGTKTQMTAVKEKGWFPCYYDSETKKFVQNKRHYN